MSTNYKTNLDSNQDLTACRAGSMVRSSKFSNYNNRVLRLKDVFNFIDIDGQLHYILKDLEVSSCNWFSNKILYKAYCYNSIHMHFNFNNQDLPKRCEISFKELLISVTEHLRKTNTRLHKTKLKCTLIHLVKHISRMYYHKNYHLTYTRQKVHWSEYNTLSHTYMISIVDFLVQEGLVKSYSGYQNSKNISSMLTVCPNFIQWCNGKNPPEYMDNCLKSNKDKLTVKIHIEDSKGNKKARSIRRGEKIMVSKIEEVVSAYNTFLEDSHIMVNGIAVPELFFTRVFNVDLEHGGRFYDDGSIQGQNAKTRANILIDGEVTQELDYKSLHYAMAAEELGIDMTHKDPYDFPYDIPVDSDVISAWKEEVGYAGKYNPIRNIKKTAILVMFNADSEASAISGISEAILKDYKKKDRSKRKYVGLTSVKVKELVQQIKIHNHEVSSYFLTGVGKRFQKLDSDMIEFCIKEFVKRGQVCIPIHDSLVTKQSITEKLTRPTMENAFHNVMGSSLNCKVV